MAEFKMPSEKSLQFLQAHGEAVEKAFLKLCSQEENGCMRWLGTVANGNSPRFEYQQLKNKEWVKRHVPARRWAWTHFVDFLPENEYVFNICGNPRCVAWNDEHNLAMTRTEAREFFKARDPQTVEESFFD